MNNATRDRSKAAARNQQQETPQANTAMLDRPVCDEIKQIFVTSMTSTYDACLEARNRGISAGLQRFRDENSTGNDDFFADWEIEAEQILESRLVNQNALPSSQVVIDLKNLNQYDLQTLRDRHNDLTELDNLSEAETIEIEALKAYILPRLELSNACSDLSSHD